MPLANWTQYLKMDLQVPRVRQEWVQALEPKGKGKASEKDSLTKTALSLYCILTEFSLLGLSREAERRDQLPMLRMLIIFLVQGFFGV